MKINQWTLSLLSLGAISLPSVVQADEAPSPLSPLLTAVAKTTLSGYVDTSATWMTGTGNANLPGRVYDGPDTQDGFNLNLVSLTLDKPLDETSWAAGYHVQMIMGPFAAKRGTGLINPVSTPSGPAPASSVTEFAFNEAYVALRVPVGNGIDFKIGQYGTYNGFEAFDSYKDPNWSRSYGFYIETSAHTGISANYKVNDMISVQAGIGNVGPYNSQVNAKSSSESSKAYLGMVTFTAPESFGFAKGASVSGGYTVGPANGANSSRVNQMYIGGTIPTPLKELSLGIAYDYAANIVGKSTYANATALYVIYQATEKLKLNTRFDYASGTEGAYGYAAVASNHPRNELFAATLTADYSLWKNVLSRAELRWDHSLTGDRIYGGTVAGAPDKRNALSLTGNLVYMF
jgi:hypothetical protein